MNDVTIEQLQQMRGHPVYSSDGAKIGSVEEIFADIDTRRPEWVGVGTGLFKTKRVVVPVASATLSADEIRVGYTKDQVANAPDVDKDEIPEDTEKRLYEYYGLSWSERMSESVLPEGGRKRPTGRDEATLTRSEEELAVGKRPVEAGRVRLRKWVETERVEEPVELRKEKARVERRPVDRTATSGDIGEQDVEVALESEEPVVDKRTVAKEEVSVSKDTETETETVGGDVRRERIDVEGEGLDEEGRRAS